MRRTDNAVKNRWYSTSRRSMRSAYKYVYNKISEDSHLHELVSFPVLFSRIVGILPPNGLLPAAYILALAAHAVGTFAGVRTTKKTSSNCF